MITRKAVITVAILSLAILALQLIACSDSTSPDSDEATVTGSVLDDSGEPVSGASILVSYRPSFDDLLQPEKGYTFTRDLPPPLNIDWIRVVNACQDTIRTICDQDCSGEISNTVMWDGLDDTGARVVDGLYFLVMSAADTISTHDLVLITEYHNWNTEDCQYHARTGADGSYTLSDECLGFGHDFESVDENGESTGTRTITRMVNLRALSSDGKVARCDSVLFPETGSAVVDFVMPD